MKQVVYVIVHVLYGSDNFDFVRMQENLAATTDSDESMVIALNEAKKRNIQAESYLGDSRERLNLYCIEHIWIQEL